MSRLNKLLQAGANKDAQLAADLRREVEVLRRRRPFGLNFERHVPGLKSTCRIERGGDKPFHTVINAENFHALRTLLYTHRGQVDAIYT